MAPEDNLSTSPEKKERPVWKFLASVNLTIFLLVFLAVSSIIGTLIPQNQIPAAYIQRYGYGLYQFLDALSLFNLYHSAWYRLILALLVLNLLVCTTDRLRHLWDIVFPKERKINEKAILSRPGTRTITCSAGPSEVKTALRPVLSANLGRIKEVPVGSGAILWQEKGRLTRLGVYVVHLSIILFYIAGIASSVGGFRTSVELAEGQAVEQVRLPHVDLLYDLGFALRLDRFEAQFYPTGQPKEYRSDVTIIENGRPVVQGNIRVNHPLTHKGITFYQSSYGRFPKAVTVTLENKNTGGTIPVSLPFGQETVLPRGWGSLRSLGYEPNVMGLGPAVHLLLHSPGLGPADFWVFKNRPDFGRVKELPFRFHVTAIEEGYYTGLQVAKEPGILFVWAGSILMILGILVTFFTSHWKIWAVLERKGDRTTVTLGGQANKNKARLEDRLDRLYKQLQKVNMDLR